MFNAKLKDELLNGQIFDNILKAIISIQIAGCRRVNFVDDYYNHNKQITS